MSGADMDKQGNLYLWDTRNYRMQVLRPSGSGAWLDRPGWQLEIGSQPHQIYGGPHQIYGDGVAIDRKRDRVYIADPENGRIKVYTTDGDAIGIITITGYVQSIRTDDEGNLYALTMWDGIKKYNAKGQQIAHNANNFLIYNYIGRGIAVSRTGEVFFAKDVTDGIIKFSPDLQSHITVTLHLTSGLPVTRPTALIVDDQNTLFVFDHQKFKLFAFDANGNQLDRSWPSPPFQSGGGVFLAQHGDYIYLIGEYDGLILQLPKQGGEPLHTWGGIVGNHGSIGYPEDIAIAPDNSLFFADSWTGRIGKMINDQIVQS